MEGEHLRYDLDRRRLDKNEPALLLFWIISSFLMCGLYKLVYVIQDILPV